MQRGIHKAAVAHVTTLHSVPRRRLDLLPGLARVWIRGRCRELQIIVQQQYKHSVEEEEAQAPPPPPPASHPKRRIKTEEPRPSDASGDPTATDDPPLRKIKKEEVYGDKE